jgi:hypothetical protein
MVMVMSMAAKMARSRIAPQGWFADPMDQTRQRFWSGQQWLDFTRDPRHPARLLKKSCPPNTQPPTVEPVWRVVFFRIVFPAFCALLASVLLATFITAQQEGIVAPAKHMISKTHSPASPVSPAEVKAPEVGR